MIEDLATFFTRWESRPSSFTKLSDGPSTLRATARKTHWNCLRRRFQDKGGLSPHPEIPGRGTGTLSRRE